MHNSPTPTLVSFCGMTNVQQIAGFLDQFAPARLAADWDNVGLLVGEPTQAVTRVMACLTITENSSAEAIAQGAELVVTHHPLPFRPFKQIVTSQPTGKLLWELIRAGVSIYSPHTAFDSAARGINQLWAELLGLQDVVPLDIHENTPTGTGVGRCGRLKEPKPLRQIANEVAGHFSIPGVHLVGEPDRIVAKIGIACGSGGSMLALAERTGCDLFITGEATFHTCLEAEALGMAMILPGHYASERFGVEHLASVLSEQFPDCVSWASTRERDPLRWVNA